MGSCCDSNNEQRILAKNSNQNPPPSYPSYNLSKKNNNYKATNNDLYANSRAETNYITNYKSNNYNGNSNSKSIKPKTNKKFISNEFEQFKLIYLNMIKTMASQKKTIGQGGQAKVRKYYSNKFKRTVVEKVIDINNDDLGYEGILNAINLYKEGILLAGLDHPNIVKIYDIIMEPPAIIMEYCPYGSLRNILNTKVLNPLYKIYLIYSICKGLNYVHSKGIVHGDLKCDNILLSAQKIGNFPIPKLADFGLGQFRPNKVRGGTPGFIAPEIFKGSGLNFKTDIFALGMVMFEILSGLRPMPSDPELALAFLKENRIPCTKEILRKAWELRIEEFLPEIKNAYFDAFYTLMISCIDDDPNKRPPISAILIIVKNLYEILLQVAIDLDDKSNDSFY